MKTFRSLRVLLLAMAVSVIPATSFAGVFISVGFAPPVLPVYEQPPCPEEGWIWTPGYWAYGDDGYYWVPGTWVPAPFEGALWTPPWWGWDDGLYVYHPGYWGYHVGYYGGVNYGFGYMGVGFVGGMWRGPDFVYNTAVVHVDERVIRNVYIDRTVVERNTIINDRHVAFSGGPGGIRHEPQPEERFADRDRHVEATDFQHSHESAAMADRSFHARYNGGHPNNVVMQRPMAGNWQHNAVQQNQGGNRGNYQNNENAQRWNGGNGDNRNNSPQPGYQDRGGRNNSNAQPGYQNQGNRNNNYNAQPNYGNNQNRNFGGPPPNNPNADNRYNDNHRQSPGNNPPPPNNGYQQNRNNDNAQRWNNSNNSDRNFNNGQRGGNAPYRATPQPESRPAPPPPPQQRNDQGNHGGDHGDHGHDREH